MRWELSVAHAPKAAQCRLDGTVELLGHRLPDDLLALQQLGHQADVGDVADDGVGFGDGRAGAGGEVLVAAGAEADQHDLAACRVHPLIMTLGTGLTGTSYNGSAGVTTTVDVAFSPTWTGTHTFANASSLRINNAADSFYSRLVSGATKSAEVVAALP